MFNKNLTIKEQFLLINRNLKKSNNNLPIDIDYSLEIDNFYINNLIKNGRFIFKEITEDLFFKYQVLFNSKNALIIKGGFFNFLVEKNVLSTKNQSVLKIQDKKVINPLTSVELNIPKRYILNEGIENGEYILDSGIFQAFYITTKTANNFSQIIMTKENKIFYLMRRAKRYAIFAIII